MPITVYCPRCRTRLTMGEERAGTSFDCPQCHTVITIPIPAWELVEPVLPPPRVIEYQPDPAPAGEPDDEPEPYVPRRRRRVRSRRRPLPIVAPVACCVTAIVLLLMSSAMWSRAAEIRRSYGGITTTEVDKYANSASVLLLAAVAGWAIGTGLLIARTSNRHLAVGWGAFGAMIGGVLAIPVSQYMPFFGGELTTVADPWSPARLSGIGLHFGLLAMFGAMVLGGLAALAEREDRW